MGLLDNAIREHLDLKRARGADPAEIERLEREALGPVRRQPTVSSAPPEPRFEPVGEHDDYEYLDLPEHDIAAEVADPPPPRRRFRLRNRGAEPPAGAPEDPERQYAAEHDELIARHELLEHDDLDEHGYRDDRYDVGDEPATELHQPGEPPHLTFNQPPKRPRFTAEPPIEDSSAEGDEAHEDSVSEEPHDQAAPEHDEPVAHHHESQTTREFDVEEAFDSDEPDDEDVLEETPEFLQDTPEHDRLWFEQRPPKDFDFDS
jgi:hypothetical protein